MMKAIAQREEITTSLRDPVILLIGELLLIRYLTSILQSSTTVCGYAQLWDSLGACEQSVAVSCIKAT